MKRALLLPLVLVAGVVGIDALADATQNRPDRQADPGSASAVTFEVDGRNFPHRQDPGQVLWVACQGTFGSATLHLAEVGEGTYRATVQPALGEHAQRRLRGCLDDATVDRLSGHLVGVETLARPDLDPATGSEVAASPGR